MNKTKNAGSAGGRIGRRVLKGLGVLLAVIALSALGLKIAGAANGVSLGAEFFVVVLRAFDFKGNMESVEATEAAIAKNHLKGDAPPPQRVRDRFDVTQETVDGAAVYTVTPRSTQPQRTMIYLHGGAYTGPIIEGYWDNIGEMAERSGARAVVPLYLVAPEHDWKQAYAMLDKVYDQLITQVPPASIVIAGDSAGGGLALGFAEALRDEGKPAPGGVLLYSPWLNLIKDNPAQAALEAVDPMLARPGLEWSAERWANGTPLEDPHISPVFGSLKGLPPILMFSGTRDMLNADAHQLVERAHEQGAQLTYVESPNMIHVFMGLPIPEAQPVREQADAFIHGGN